MKIFIKIYNNYINKNKLKRKKIISMPLIPICLIPIFKYIKQYRFNKREICLRMYVFVSEDHMLDWHLCQICYPLKMKLLERERESTGTSSFKINLNLCDAKPPDRG